MSIPQLAMRFIMGTCMLLLVIPGRAQTAPASHYFISGKVVDDAGKPVEEAQVQVFIRKPSESASGGGSSAYTSEYTDKDGSFTLQLPSDATVLASANFPGLVTDYKVLTKQTSSLDFVLKNSGRKLSGKVVDDQGKPVPFAQVAVDAKIEAPESPLAMKRLLLGSHFQLDLQADENGRLIIEDLPALPVRVYSVSPESKDHLDQLFRETLKEPTADLTNGDPTDLTIRLDDQ